MRPCYISVAIFVCLLPFSARAEVNCSVFDAVERIQFAQNRLAEAGERLFASQDATLLIDNVARLDLDQINTAHGGKLSAPEAATLVFYLQYAQRLSVILRNRNKFQAQDYFNHAQFILKQQAIARILPRLKCNTFSSEGTSNGSQRVMSSIKQEAGARKITIVGGATFLASLVFFVAITHRIYVLTTAWRLRRKRRSKRFHCHIETQINYGSLHKRCAILDISCNGAKIQVDLETEEANVEIWIINSWHKAKVSWYNAHYLGVRFDKPLRSAFVETICNPVV